MILMLALGFGAIPMEAPAEGIERQSPPAALTACNQTDFQTLLSASAEAKAPEDITRKPPQAIWLNGHLLQWPEADHIGNFKLYHSNQGQLRLERGKPATGFDDVIRLQIRQKPLPPKLNLRFKYLPTGPVLEIEPTKVGRLGTILRGQLLLAQEDTQGKVIASTPIQIAGALDDLYAKAGLRTDLGVQVNARQTRFTLWAPTAQLVQLCHFDSSTGGAIAAHPMVRDAKTGLWSYRHQGSLDGQYYTYLVDNFVQGVGLIRNRVTDPYSVSLNADSQRSFIGDLNDAQLKPPGWDHHVRPRPLKSAVDMSIYELHVRDFSLNDATVPSQHRGKYLAFGYPESNGMRHLNALAKAGITDIHLLPIFDVATIPEVGCAAPAILEPAQGDSEIPQAMVHAVAAADCFNWGYDPFHFNAPEGSYATDVSQAQIRVREVRKMVMALHEAGLRVGMDMVYNHTTASGQQARSILDRIVPGYYQRLNVAGAVERSTCCDNTATENLMMAKLMLDSVELWTRQYQMDSFRFDLMAHQPRSAMVDLQNRVNRIAGRHINLIGEGWNFGEVANGARFVQASQLSLNGTGIATFSDRGRDAIRGGSAGDNGEAQIANQGYINGMVYDRNALSKATREDLLRTADLVRVGLAGSIRNFKMLTSTGQTRSLVDIDYGGGQPAGYVSQPGEVVNYIENHDNQTLYDLNVFRLPIGTTREDRVRVQMLGVAINALSQGIAYYHAGTEILRSKSMDRNSFDSGDWFNRLDWTYQTNHFGTGLPPKGDNAASWPLMRPYLVDPMNRPTPGDIALAREMFNDLLRIRSSTTLLRLRTAADIENRLSFRNLGPGQNPVVIVGHVDGKNYPGARYRELLYFINVDKASQTLTLPQEAGKAYGLHPIHRSEKAADKRPLDSVHEHASGQFTIPPRTAVVYVLP